METLIYAIILSFILTLVSGCIIIPLLEKLKFGQNVRDDGPKSHLKKAGTPTMGGIIFLIPVCLVSIIMSNKSLDFVTVAVLVTLGFALIGLIDDLIKIAMRRSLGLRAYQKLIGQVGIAVIFAFYVYRHVGSSVFVPFLNSEWDLGIFYVPFVTLVIVGTVNSVNLTDGLDGLATGVTLIVAASLGIVAVFVASKTQDEGLAFLSQNYRNLSIFTGALTGGCLGFLRFNAYPAKVFMGDTGSMGLGGAIAAISILLKWPLLLLIIGGVYVAEAVSVILQVVCFKITGRRILRMSPLHHHFELGGMHESRVVAMFMIGTAILCFVGLLSI